MKRSRKDLYGRLGQRLLGALLEDVLSDVLTESGVSDLDPTQREPRRGGREVKLVVPVTRREEIVLFAMPGPYDDLVDRLLEQGLPQGQIDAQLPDELESMTQRGFIRQLGSPGGEFVLTAFGDLVYEAITDDID